MSPRRAINNYFLSQIIRLLFKDGISKAKPSSLGTNFLVVCFQLPENGASNKLLDSELTDFGSLPSLKCLITTDENLTNGEEMHLLACSVYHSLLKHMPALVTLRISFLFFRDIKQSRYNEML